MSLSSLLNGPSRRRMALPAAVYPCKTHEASTSCDPTPLLADTPGRGGSTAPVLFRKDVDPVTDRTGVTVDSGTNHSTFGRGGRRRPGLG